MTLNPTIYNACKARQVLKVILGLSNFNLQSIVPIIKAADVAGATYIDIAANVSLLKEIRNLSNLPICVSSIDIDELISCHHFGADILEIGNFDIFYSKGFNFSAEQVLNMTDKLLIKVPNASVSVTIPHKLSMQSQIELAQALERMGIDMIQTEGISSQQDYSNSLFHSIDHASASLSSTAILSKCVTLPIITSSGINSITAPIAVSYGASGIGVGSFFKKTRNINNLICHIDAIMYSLRTNYLAKKQLDYIELQHAYYDCIISYC
uniref:Uncharacterized protein ycf23 n=1 Tax=Galaxaura rugosa TaxID=268570 RepID=A0A1G4NSQ3_9FLOR|nr:Hypothetical protein ycf23 [Galaxaura rugosa]SCW21712.1 Hypothetical protein ycf23 [Galaxaura rugosa]